MSRKILLPMHSLDLRLSVFFVDEDTWVCGKTKSQDSNLKEKKYLSM